MNYYGLQRFGSFSTSTDEIGMKLLQEDLKGAIDLILDFHPSALAAAKGEIPNTNISSDDRNRALALHIWRTEGNSQKALERMPRKFSAETNIIRHLSAERRGEKIHQNDWQGALSGIQRNLRLMYVHAYQSLVWNVVSGKRWELYGNKVVEGDLIIIGDKDGMNGAAEEVDELGEIIVRPGAGDSAVTDRDFTRARPLSKEEVEGGKWDIFDVVLPIPGWDVCYPTNAIGEYYKEFMGSEKGGGLDPHNMRRKWKDISLSGGYRKVLARPAGIDWEVKTYRDENEQLVETDLDRLTRASVFVDDEDSKMMEDGEMKEDREKRIAIILKLQLGSSQYATMALRELMKAGGVKSYKADFGGRGT
jgi:tRNA pseudouridine13 synthase